MCGFSFVSTGGDSVSYDVDRDGREVVVYFVFDYCKIAVFFSSDAWYWTERGIQKNSKRSRGNNQEKESSVS